MKQPKGPARPARRSPPQRSTRPRKQKRPAKPRKKAGGRGGRVACDGASSQPAAESKLGGTAYHHFLAENRAATLQELKEAAEAKGVQEVTIQDLFVAVHKKYCALNRAERTNYKRSWKKRQQEQEQEQEQEQGQKAA
mmetsp:Transcript_8523/g.32077  ORF Transcript_8523/g.32077 Transcript_8523/m.32077 type:complete len:138 (-) Transcript_8523:190-603(-)